ncbi:hypothetical protein Agub_g5581, partial [Astrephomene gubernaculifera]
MPLPNVQNQWCFSGNFARHGFALSLLEAHGLLSWLLLSVTTKNETPYLLCSPVGLQKSFCVAHPVPNQQQWIRLYSKPSDVSSDWTALYLGSKLAYWSGLCYLPYDTICRTVQQEGLQLVAYGRTSYTCWYVADGCVDFEALHRRALPRQQQQREGGRGLQAHQQQQHAAQQQQGGLHQQLKAQQQQQQQSPVQRSLHDQHWDTRATQADEGSAGGTGSNHSGDNDGDAGEFMMTPGSHAATTASGEDISVSSDGRVYSSTAAHRANAAGITPGSRCRFIFLRGVQWGAHDGDTLSLSAALASFWPTPLLPTDPSAHGLTAASSSATTQAAASTAPTAAPASTAPQASEPRHQHPAVAAVVAHSGVAGMARELLPVLLPYIREGAAAQSGPGADTGAAPTPHHQPHHHHQQQQQPQQQPQQVVLAGHSLGGSLALLLWAMTLAQGARSPATISCHTFGSPPVLAHATGGGSSAVLRELLQPLPQPLRTPAGNAGGKEPAPRLATSSSPNEQQQQPPAPSTPSAPSP